MKLVEASELRARFARRLSDLYGSEVPAYNTLVEVSHGVNTRVVERDGADAERLGSIGRVTAERHGAIRVGTPTELSQAARIFAALGMRPTGFYDLRDAKPQPIPVVSTAFRPIDRAELAKNPFRVFTSMLVPEDRRFFDPDLEVRLRRFLDARELFPPRLLDLADRAEADGGLTPDHAQEFLDLAARSFALSSEPVDRAWYEELERVSGVAADIGGVPSTHINHLTPRVLDIDDLYASMQSRGITMIDAIQGPPRWDGPDVLLRQTSFRALAEPRRMREPDGSVTTSDLRVRFGEVEARGLALTPAGRDLYDHLVAQIDEQHATAPARPRPEIAERVWREHLPSTEAALALRDLAYFTFTVCDVPPEGPPPTRLPDLIEQGWVVPEPIVYEDFLPRSAAGIFASNLTTTGTLDTDQGGAPRDLTWLSEAIERTVNDPYELYAGERRASLDRVAQQLALTDAPTIG